MPKVKNYGICLDIKLHSKNDRMFIMYFRLMTAYQIAFADQIEGISGLWIRWQSLFYMAQGQLAKQRKIRMVRFYTFGQACRIVKGRTICFFENPH
jgi:hypothetical protein